MINHGDFVIVTSGFLNSEIALGPIPESLVGAYGQIVATGREITEAIEPGPVWGSYSKRQLPAPVGEIRLRILSEGEWFGKLLEVDGLVWRKLSPLEVLALQQDKGMEC